MKNILFLCVANSGRSQLAEGLARRYYPDLAVYQSAGSRPAAVSPYTLEVMNEIGIDVSKHVSKSVDTIDLSKLDLVITLCAEEECPMLPVKVRKLHWPVDDPADAPDDRESQLHAYREARVTIKQKLEQLPAELD